MKILWAITLSLFLSACAGTTHHESTGEYLDNAAITSKVKATLVQNMGIATMSNISVSSQKGLVYLTGTVDSVSEKYRAESLSKGIAGVNTVENRLRIAIH